MSVSSLFKMRILSFKKNKRAVFSLYLFIALLALSLLAPLWVNDRPLFIYKDHKAYFPMFKNYAEVEFGGDFFTSTDYNDPYVQNTLLKDAFIIHVLIPYSYDTIIMDLDSPAPNPPSFKHLLGTDDQARDVLARLVYGYRVSLVFGILLTLFSVLIGVSLGAFQGYYGGLVDLVGQRLSEIWSAIPMLFLLIVISSAFNSNFWIILFLVLLFSWMGLSQVVRTEFLKAKNMDYTKAARALGVNDLKIIFYHVLPNALVATITYVPFLMAASISTLVSLDFLGFGMPIGSASLGELVNQGKDNLTTPHLAIVAFVAISLLLSVLVFIGEGVRDAFNANMLK
ncbi:ABC transporter permease [Helicobacter pylori]|uniref:ABC transporter permease n=1 Tax=Helicobacter pylori TaxID=210 RepID=UPI001A99158F|nr:ABC transporter permease [Helicobacter pylori]